MTLMDMVRAHLAADELSRQRLPYDLALAVVKVKKATADETTFFLEKERELVDEYADKDQAGNLRLATGGRFIFREPARAGEYERRRRELSATQVDISFPPIRVRPPDEIKPEHIEALEGFLTFAEPEKEASET